MVNEANDLRRFPALEDVLGWRLFHVDHHDMTKTWKRRLDVFFPNIYGALVDMAFYPDDPYGEGSDIIVKYQEDDGVAFANFHIYKSHRIAELSDINVPRLYSKPKE